MARSPTKHPRCTSADDLLVYEQTSLDVGITGLNGIFPDPEHVIAYDNGEVRQEFSVGNHSRMARHSPT
jgi:hypothetical protein